MGNYGYLFPLRLFPELFSDLERIGPRGSAKTLGWTLIALALILHLHIVSIVSIVSAVEDCAPASGTIMCGVARLLIDMYSLTQMNTATCLLSHNSAGSGFSNSKF